MKKYLLMACALVAGAFAFNSCGSSDDDDAPKTNLTTPKYAEHAYKFVFSDTPIQEGETSTKELELNNPYVAQAEFTEGGLFVGKIDQKIVPNGSKLRRIATVKDMGDTEFVWVMGAYTVKVEGNVINLIVADGELTFTITADNGNTTSITLNASQLAEVVNLNAQEMKVVANDNVDGDLCRTWKVVKTNLIYTPYENGKAKAAVAKSFNGANLKEISDYLYDEQDLDIRDELLKHGNSIEKVAFTKRGSFAIDFGQSISMGDWSWTDKSKGVFSYTWYEDDMENDFDGDGATVRFDGNNCVLVLNGKVRESANNKEYTVFLQFTMQAPAQ